MNSSINQRFLNLAVGFFITVFIIAFIVVIVVLVIQYFKSKKESNSKSVQVRQIFNCLRK